MNKSGNMIVRKGLLFYVLTWAIAPVQTTARNYITIPTNSNIYYGNSRNRCYTDRGSLPVLSPLSRDVTFDTMLYEQITVEHQGTYKHVADGYLGTYDCNKEEIHNVTGTGVEFQILDRQSVRFHTVVLFVFLNEQDFLTYLRSSITPVS